jgi:hypothetical protein
MRRFQMACPECGYEWEEASVAAYRASWEAKFGATVEKGAGFLFLGVATFGVLASVAYLLLLLFELMFGGPFIVGLIDLVFVVSALALIVGACYSVSPLREMYSLPWLMSFDRVQDYVKALMGRARR